MLILYRILTIVVFLFLPLVLIYRIFKKKENHISIQQKLCLFSKKILKKKTIWFHGASVGELQSIVPLIEKYEKNKNVKRILVTSNTLSSSNVLKELKFKKTIHQFLPLDINFFTEKFLNHWDPSIAIFIDSEIWPNMILNLKRRKKPLILLNGRITKKSFKKWMWFSNFAHHIFGKFDLCLSSSKESKQKLKKLGAHTIKYLGNLKFSQSENKKNIIKKYLKNFIKEKKVWCAASTHYNEEILCGHVHKKLQKKYKNLLTIIIPRHIDRVDTIKSDLTKLGLSVHLDKPNTIINKNIDIYLVNTYGKTKSFYSNCKNVFLGGSIINHGGQNPLEAARYGCNILHGKNITNFREIYNFLNKNDISYTTNTTTELYKRLDKLFSKKRNSYNKISNKIKFIGFKILNETNNEINVF